MEEIQKFLDEDAIIAAPNEPHFYNPVPSEGYKLVAPGHIIKGDELKKFLAFPAFPLCFPGDETNTNEEFVEPEFKAISITGNQTTSDNKLLLPQGGFKKARDPFKQEGGETLFSVLGKLDSEEDILKFASEHGNLGEGKNVIDGVKDTIPLVAIRQWKDEVEQIKAVMKIYDAYNDKKDLEKYINHFYSDRRCNRPGIVHPGFTEVVLTNPDKGIELFNWSEPTEDFRQQDYRVLVKKGIARLVNAKIDCQVTYKYFVGKDIYEPNRDDEVRTFLVPQTLRAAIWLSFAWGFFKDGPKERQWERCYISGNYYNRWKRDRNGNLTTNLRQRKRGDHKGLFYHPDENDKRRKKIEYQKKNKNKKK